MKPKNLVHCQAIGRSKMLFDSESKAENFLKFNREEILEESGKAPVRSYYCVFCCGWHLTSNCSKEAGERIEKDLRNKVEIISELNKLRKKPTPAESLPEANRIKNQFGAKLEEFHIFLMTGRYNEAEDVLLSCSLDVDDLELLQSNHDKIDKKIDKCRDLMDIYYDMRNTPDEKRQRILRLPNPNKTQRQAMSVIVNLRILDQVNAVLQNADSLICCEDDSIVNEILESCESKLNSLNGPAANKALTYFKSLLNNIKQERLIYLKGLKIQGKDGLIIQAKEETSSSSAVEEQSLEEYDSTATNQSKIVLPYNYSQDMVSLIDRVVKVRSLYEAGDDLSAEDELDICYLLLDQIGVETEETKLVRSQLDQFRSNLSQAGNI